MCGRPQARMQRSVAEYVRLLNKRQLERGVAGHSVERALVVGRRRINGERGTVRKPLGTKQKSSESEKWNWFFERAGKLVSRGGRKGRPCRPPTYSYRTHTPSAPLLYHHQPSRQSTAALISLSSRDDPRSDAFTSFALHRSTSTRTTPNYHPHPHPRARGNHALSPGSFFSLRSLT